MEKHKEAQKTGLLDMRSSTQVNDDDDDDSEQEIKLTNTTHDANMSQLSEELAELTSGAGADAGSTHDKLPWYPNFLDMCANAQTEDARNELRHLYAHLVLDEAQEQVKQYRASTPNPEFSVIEELLNPAIDFVKESLLEMQMQGLMEDKVEAAGVGQ